MTKVLFISNDPLIFDTNSAARARMREYAALFTELHIVSRARFPGAAEAKEGNLFLYPVSGFFSLLRRARRTVREHDIDVISAQDPFEYGLIAYLARLGSRTKLHVQLHTDMFSPYFRLHPTWNLARLFIARFLFRRAYGIRVVSERMKVSLEALGHKPGAVSVLPIFTDLEKFKDLPRLKHPRFKIALLVISRLEREKNVALAIRALKVARDGGHDAGLIVVGDGRERTALQELARSLGVERFVEFSGWQHDITRFLSFADLLLFPSHYDGYGLAIMEALSAGVPVLATDVGVAREAGAMVVRDADFANALVRWCESGPRRGELYHYSYKDKNEYLQHFKTDIEFCLKRS